MFISQNLSIGGGAEKYYIEMAKLISKNENMSVDIVTLNSDSIGILNRLVQLYYLSFKKIKPHKREAEREIKITLGDTKWIQSSLMNLNKTLERYDIVYSRNELIDLFVLLFAPSVKKLIIGFHTAVYYPYIKKIRDRVHNILYSSFIYRFLARKASILHVVNQADYKWAMKNFPNKIVTLIYYPYSVASARKTTPTNKNNLNVLFVGRLEFQKGIDIFIDVIKHINSTKIGSNFSFTIAGSGNQKNTDDIIALETEYNNVNYVGHIKNSEINKLYTQCDVVLIPSRAETTNYVALETGSQKRIAVASDVPGPQDIIENNKTGFLLPLDSNEFIKKTEYLYRMKQNNSSAFSAIGQNAYNHIQDKFGEKIITEKMIKMFLQV